MTQEESKIFSSQVLEVINRQQGAEDYPYFGLFVQDCERLGLSEDQFRKQILVQAFKSYSGYVEPTSGAFTIVFGFKCYSLRKFGEVLFDHPVKSEAYLEDAILFKEDVRKLVDTDQTMELIDILNKETVISRRYLRLSYHLNPTLPYRIGQAKAENVKALLNIAYNDYAFYERVAAQFTAGYLQIWIEETAPDLAGALDEGQEYNDFLRFAFKVDPKYPIYFGERLVKDPSALVTLLQTDFEFREHFYLFIKNKQLQVWFESIRRSAWTVELNDALKIISNYEGLNSRDKKQAAVQRLIRIIDPSVDQVQLLSETKEIDLTKLEASKPLQHAVVIQLRHTGVLKCQISLKDTIEGVGINQSEIQFNSFKQEVSLPIFLEIDSIKLVKGQVYQTELVVTSIDAELFIPVRLMAVYPRRAVATTLMKYAGIGAVYFMIIRFILAALIQSPGWLSIHLGFNTLSYGLPHNYLAFVFAAFLLFGGVFLAMRIIKRTEKI
ncbi:hypothetical protein [Mucilaginibacter sp. PAMB04168]|uniref:hypothetical protein n=1 Tax=Mucilaginibacter sp. PAMB04168 TaxID=3138567 RepID=UPI0031F688CD